MVKKPINFILSGIDAEAASKELKAALQEIFECDVQTEVQKERPCGETIRAVDPIAIAALIISIPSAVLAIADLINRSKKKKQLEEVLEQIKTLQKKKSVTVKIQYPDGTLKEITTVESVALLDEFNQ